MSSHQRNHTAVIRWLLFVCLLYSGADVEAQTGVATSVPTPAAPTQAVPSKSTEASGGSEEKLVTYQLKHAKAAEVLKIWQKLLGGYTPGLLAEILTISAEEAIRVATSLLDGVAIEGTLTISDRYVEE